MFPEAGRSSCPWCGLAFAVEPHEGTCPDCGQSCGTLVYAMDVFEGKSRPRPLYAALAWSLCALAGSIAAVLALGLGRGSIGDAIIFTIFFLVLLIIAIAETHGVWMMRRDTAPRRVILTSEGVELIDPHRIRGVTSVEWDEMESFTVEAAKGGGARLTVFRHGPKQRIAAIKAVTASTAVTPDQINAQIDRLKR